jgi:multicomponent Na+:H+ antiporter subunit D
MSAGAVLYMTGKSKCTELGGLYKTMPWTLIFGTIGALAISSFPGTSGFTSKSLIIDAAVHRHLVWVWIVLEIASAGVFLHAGIKFPYFVFFAKDQGLRPGEPHKAMLTAMGLMAFLCIFLGIYPKPLYDVLPYEVHYQAYTAGHVVGQMQLLMLSALVFFLFLPLLKRTDTLSLDTDWFYRRGGRLFYRWADRSLNGINAFCDTVFARKLSTTAAHFFKNGPTRIALPIITSVYALFGYDRKKLSLLRSKIGAAFESDSYPLGISAIAATLFIVMLFLFD